MKVFGTSLLFQEENLGLGLLKAEQHANALRDIQPGPGVYKRSLSPPGEVYQVCWGIISSCEEGKETEISGKKTKILKKWGLGRILSCRELYTPLVRTKRQ